MWIETATMIPQVKLDGRPSLLMPVYPGVCTGCRCRQFGEIIEWDGESLLNSIPNTHVGPLCPALFNQTDWIYKRGIPALSCQLRRKVLEAHRSRRLIIGGQC